MPSAPRASARHRLDLPSCAPATRGRRVVLGRLGQLLDALAETPRRVLLRRLGQLLIALAETPRRVLLRRLGQLLDAIAVAALDGLILRGLCEHLGSFGSGSITHGLPDSALTKSL